MTDPRRLLQDSSLSEAERAALDAARTMEPPPEFASASWAGITAALGQTSGGGAGGAGPAGAGGGAAAAAGSAGGASLLGKLATLGIGKAVGVGALLGGVVTTSVVVWPSAPSPTAASGPAAPAPATKSTTNGEHAVAAPPRAAPVPDVVAGEVVPVEPAPQHAEPFAAPAPGAAVNGAASVRSAPRDVPSAAAPVPEAIAASPAASPVAAFTSPEGPTAEPAATPSAVPPPSVVEEARSVGRAREALRAGNPAEAYRQLEQARRRFPDGVVRQEREALSIEALVRMGRREEAARRAAAFVREFAGSPHVPRVQSLVAAP